MRLSRRRIHAGGKILGFLPHVLQAIHEPIDNALRVPYEFGTPDGYEFFPAGDREIVEKHNYLKSPRNPLFTIK